jgi:hypothetical protein
MRLVASTLALLFFVISVPGVRAGLYYSGEKVADLPARWQGFLLDQRMLRVIARPPAGATSLPGTPRPDSPERRRYKKEAGRLEGLTKSRALTADEAADLGAIYLRLGEINRALEVLRLAQRRHPEHHALAANLGTAWQMQGNLAQATLWLQQAVRLAPPALKQAEELHLRLVRLRSREKRASNDLDDLFGVRYLDAEGKYTPGKIAPAEAKKLPADAIALVQRLALWLPADARLLWQLAELAALGGGLRSAAAMMDGCVIEFSLRHATLREHRQAMRAAAGSLPTPSPDRTTHQKHNAFFKPRSDRPLIHQLDLASLPTIDPRGVNPLPWSVISKTVIDRDYHPTFPKYLEQLNGKQVKVQGFIQPFGEEEELTAFMLIEYPVGCWYCEMPEITSIVLAELPGDKSVRYMGGLVEVTGKLTLNSTDPENFLYIIQPTKVGPRE